MEQLALEPPPATQRERALHESRYPGRYRPGFDEWLTANWELWRTFCAQADAMRDKGRKHYAARTIVEWMRHQTALAEAGGEFKINNNAVPDLARLYMAVTPNAKDFFELRGRA